MLNANCVLFPMFQEIMYVKGRSCGDAHGTGSRLGQGERSTKTYFPQRNHVLPQHCHSSSAVGDSLSSFHREFLPHPRKNSTPCQKRTLIGRRVDRCRQSRKKTSTKCSMVDNSVHSSAAEGAEVASGAAAPDPALSSGSRHRRRSTETRRVGERHSSRCLSRQ